MLDTAWPTVSSRKRPLRRTGRARIAREPRSFSTRTVKDAPEPPFARKRVHCDLRDGADARGNTSARGIQHAPADAA
eukprot:14875734-Alexandrium_andersonii.AAC.1